MDIKWWKKCLIYFYSVLMWGVEATYSNLQCWHQSLLAHCHTLTAHTRFQLTCLVHACVGIYLFTKRSFRSADWPFIYMPQQIYGVWLKTQLLEVLELYGEDRNQKTLCCCLRVYRKLGFFFVDVKKCLSRPFYGRTFFFLSACG